MENLRRFIKIGEDRISAEEIISYGITVDEDDDPYLYINTKSDEDIWQYYEADSDFDLDEKLRELDALFLLN